MLEGMRIGAEEVFLPFPADRSAVRPATHFRSTWLASSMRTLREHGLLERYLAVLPRELHAEVLQPIVGVWLPITLAIAHYTACDALDLTPSELIAVGNEAARRAE